MAAVLMALDPGCALGVRCEDALACPDREGACGRVGRTYYGLLKALERQEHAVLPGLKADLRRHAGAALARPPRVAGWTLLAVDGSKEELPRTRSHEAVFGIADRHFLLRVGGAASLIRGLRPNAATERRGDIVYAWPVNHQKNVAPLRLRLIRAGSKKQPVYLLTDAPDPKVSSKRAAGRVDRLRWGIDLFYRMLKRTLGYAKLRNRSGRRARIEREWGLLAAAISVMIGVQTLHQKRSDPRRLSPAARLLETLGSGASVSR
jgi:hypothetical protein